jgi:hypothetical protein
MVLCRLEPAAARQHAVGTSISRWYQTGRSDDWWSLCGANSVEYRGPIRTDCDASLVT